MPRSPRLKSSTGMYHVMMRGSNRQNIFIEDADKNTFLTIVRSALKNPTSLSGKHECRCKIYAYALMGNHFHMLVDVKSGQLGEFIKRIAAPYVKYFNQKYNRDGHLFKERFRSEPCETEDYLGILLAYIHQNPIKHGFADTLEEYPYTSWREYVDPSGASRQICDVDFVFGKMTMEQFREKVYGIFNYNNKCIDIDAENGKITDEDIFNYLTEKYSIDNPLEIKDFDKQKKQDVIIDLLDYGSSVRQLSRLTGVDKMYISRIKNR